jgi:hypothetical protein
MISSSGLRLVARTAANRSSAFQGLIRPSAIARPVLVGSGMANLLVVRNKSTMGLDQQTAVNGNDVFVHKPLQALDMHAVLRIKQELMEVDKNFDGRYVSIMSDFYRMRARMVHGLPKYFLISTDSMPMNLKLC